MKHPIAILALSLALGACQSTAERLAQVGEAPPLTQIQNPVSVANYQPVVLPMPQQVLPSSGANSLWRPGARAFFKDHRATQVGDILTVLIDIKDTADWTNTTSRERTAEENAGITNLLGVENKFNKILPGTVDPSSLADIDSTSKSEGTGSVKRSEALELKVAAIITQILPNGNLVIQGRQEVRVNFEVRELLLNGVIRPQDIESTNTVGYEKIAEARISYGGRGQITDFQQPRYGQQVFDILWPF